MLGWTLTLALAAAPEGWACVAAGVPGDDPTGALSTVATLSRELARSAPVLPPAALSSALGEVREVSAELPPEAGRLLSEAGTAFDSGQFGDAATLAREADARLGAAARSVAVESAERDAQIVWGLALAAAGSAGAEEHLAWAVAREPEVGADPGRFSPNLRARLSRVRALLRRSRGVELSIAGEAGASVYLDGVLQGEAPLTARLPAPRRAWVWLERGGRHSLAHRVDLGSARAVSIDLALESRLALADGALVLETRAGDPEAPSLLRRLAESLHVGAIALVQRCPEGPSGCWLVEARRADRVVTWRTSLEGLPRLAAELAGAEAGPAPAPLAAAAVAPAPRRRSALPWLLGGAVVAAVVTGVILYFALRPQPTSVGYSTGPSSL